MGRGVGCSCLNASGLFPIEGPNSRSGGPELPDAPRRRREVPVRRGGADEVAGHSGPAVDQGRPGARLIRHQRAEECALGETIRRIQRQQPGRIGGGRGEGLREHPDERDLDGETIEVCVCVAMDRHQKAQENDDKALMAGVPADIENNRNKSWISRQGERRHEG